MGLGCSGNTISGNLIANNTAPGIDLTAFDHDNIIFENTITNNLYGIFLSRSGSGNTISANDISNNDIGIFLEGSGYNTISANNISDNNNRGISLTVSFDPMSGEKYYPNDNNIYYNNFENNGGIIIGGNAKDVGSNTWDDGEAMGNYWDDYIGWDLFPRDGIGDIPYDIPGGDNQDRFPLMGPYPDVYITSYPSPQTNPTPSQQYSSSPRSQNQVESSSPAESEIIVVENVQYVPLDTGNGYTPRDYIHIYGNDEFTEENGVTGGSGTKEDPYIIEDWELPSIDISHTTAYFIIRHCYLYGDHAVDFSHVGNGTVQDCILEASGNGYVAFSIAYGNNIIIEYCNITNCWNAFGIYDTRDSIIHHCTINECNKAFILAYSNNNIIHHCTINGSSVAFDLGRSSNNIIHHCEMVCNDGAAAVRLGESNDNIIHTCNLSGRTGERSIWGFDLWRCSNNMIYHNNIVNFFRGNARAISCGANQWDNGAEGNYWDDYIGVDMNGDGIGDSDYHISLFNKDRYPLMGPYPDAYPYSNNQNIQSNPQSNQIQSSAVVISNPQADPENDQTQSQSSPQGNSTNS